MGFPWKKFVEVAQIVGPAALTLAGVPAPLIPLVVHGITLAEAAAETQTPMTGADKKAVALDAVRTGLAGINAATGKTVVDEEQIGHVVGNAIDVAVAAVNAAKNIPVHSATPTAEQSTAAILEKARV